MKHIIKFFQPTKYNITIFLILLIILLAQWYGSDLNSTYTYRVFYNDPSGKYTNLQNRPYCIKGNYHVGLTRIERLSFDAPIIMFLYGKVCNDITLLLANLPYTYLLACIGAFLIRRFPLKKHA